MGTDTTLPAMTRVAGDAPVEEAVAPVAPVAKGPEVIARAARILPGSPGVYRMIDDKGSVLYVGKARSLKARVQSYVRSGGHTNRIATMVSLTASMEFVTTETEVEALLLEANLIKRLKPRYNVILRDDKSFPYILIGHEHRVAQLGKHRGARAGKGSYYGPFASAGAVNRTINALQKAFLLRSCSDSVYENRTRPCLLHQIKRCSAPCTGEIALEDYDELVRAAQAFLSGRSQTVKTELARAMDEAAEWTSVRERDAMTIERDADRVARCFLLERRLLQDGGPFDGEVTGVIGAGAFVRFAGGHEGLIPVRRLGGGWWDLNDEGTILHAGESGRRIRLGDSIRVEVDRIDAPRGRVDLVPAGAGGGGADRRRRRRS